MNFGRPIPRVAGHRKLARAGIKVSYRPVSSELCLYIIEALAEGVVVANIVELVQSYPEFPGLVEAGIEYEEPQEVSKRDPDQHIGTLSEVIYKGRATCLEATAIEAAIFRRGDYDARVEIVPKLDAYGQPIEWRYHAVVRLGNDRILDPTADLKGYPKVAGQTWWEKTGHCSEDCARGKPCKSHQEEEFCTIAGRRAFP